MRVMSVFSSFSLSFSRCSALSLMAVLFFTSITQPLLAKSNDGTIAVSINSLDESGNTIQKTVNAVKDNGYVVFEGDILLAPSHETMNSGNGKSDAIIHSRNSRRWPDGILFYQFDIDYSPSNKQKIIDTMRDMEGYANITFVERTNQANYVSFDDTGGCSSYVGMIGGPQTLSLTKNCFSTRVIQHELLHALGFWHEHSRSDRDSFVEIIEENIQEGHEHNFNQHISNGLDVGDYDYLSVMQYDRTTFSQNGEPTMVRKDDRNAPLGGRSMSLQDIFALQAMYGEAAQSDREFSYQKSVDFVPPASNYVHQGFIRLRNQKGTVVNGYIYGYDDAGNEAEQVVHFSLGPFASKQLNSNDLEYGSDKKDLRGAFGSGEGSWRITVVTDTEIEVAGYIRTSDGFMTQVDATTQSEHGRFHNVPMFNPGSNYNQVSKLRLINLSSRMNRFTIQGIDDKGMFSSSSATIDILPRQTVTLSAQDLEYGNSSIGLSGSIGNGSGKWHLDVFSQSASRVMNLLEAPGGYLSNLSGSSEYKPSSAILNCKDIDGARIYGSSGEREYLGFLGSRDAKDSVFNTGEDFGSGAVEQSIHNSGGIYGSSDSDYSHANPDASMPPVIVKNGKALFYLSDNFTILGRVSLQSIENACELNSARPAEMFDMSF